MIFSAVVEFAQDQVAAAIQLIRSFPAAQFSTLSAVLVIVVLPVTFAAIAAAAKKIPIINKN